VHALGLDTPAFSGATNSFADPAAAVRGAHAIGGSINWYLNANLKLQFN